MTVRQFSLTEQRDSLRLPVPPLEAGATLDFVIRVEVGPVTHAPQSDGNMDRRVTTRVVLAAMVKNDDTDRILEDHAIAIGRGVQLTTDNVVAEPVGTFADLPADEPEAVAEPEGDPNDPPPMNPREAILAVLARAAEPEPLAAVAAVAEVGQNRARTILHELVEAGTVVVAKRGRSKVYALAQPEPAADPTEVDVDALAWRVHDLLVANPDHAYTVADLASVLELDAADTELAVDHLGTQVPLAITDGRVTLR